MNAIDDVVNQLVDERGLKLTRDDDAAVSARGVEELTTAPYAPVALPGLTSRRSSYLYALN